MDIGNELISNNQQEPDTNSESMLYSDFGWLLLYNIDILSLLHCWSIWSAVFLDSEKLSEQQLEPDMQSETSNDFG